MKEKHCASLIALRAASKVKGKTLGLCPKPYQGRCPWTPPGGKPPWTPAADFGLCLAKGSASSRQASSSHAFAISQQSTISPPWSSCLGKNFTFWNPQAS